MEKYELISLLEHFFKLSIMPKAVRFALAPPHGKHVAWSSAPLQTWSVWARSVCLIALLGLLNVFSIECDDAFVRNKMWYRQMILQCNHGATNVFDMKVNKVKFGRVVQTLDGPEILKIKIVWNLFAAATFADNRRSWRGQLVARSQLLVVGVSLIEALQLYTRCLTTVPSQPGARLQRLSVQAGWASLIDPFRILTLWPATCYDML